MGGVLLARGGGRMLKFVQGLSEVAGHRYVAHTIEVVPYNEEASV